jgi:hypothetical protein
MLRLGHAIRLAGVVRFADDVEILLQLRERTQAFAEYGVVVDEQRRPARWVPQIHEPAGTERASSSQLSFATHALSPLVRSGRPLMLPTSVK